jgi:UDP-GlcNAc:undecaprenyl-phosphate/decaprenyl-phosphate GlcNAc-1-phosphate transferase
MRGGLGQRQALLCIIVVSMACAGFGIVLERVWPQNEAISFGLWLIMLGTYFKFVVKHAFKFAQGLRRLGVKESV